MIARRLSRFYEAANEWRLGIDTSEVHSPIDESRPDFRGYAPVRYADWRRIRKQIDASPSQSFIDYGSGLGRVLILASQMPFRRVIGIELDEDLAIRARSNISKAKRHLIAPIEIIATDATKYDVPLDACTFFFNNPFAGVVLDSVLARIQLSLRTRPRPALILCNLPLKSAFEEQIKRTSWLSLERQLSLSAGERKLMVMRP